jgi:hypothetical protein
MQPHPIVEKLRALLPPIFPGPKIKQLSGGTFNWDTIANQKSQGKIPSECFVRSGSGPNLVDRDLFLDWWASTLSDARQNTRPAPPRPRAGQRSPRRRSDAAEASPAAG